MSLLSCNLRCQRLSIVGIIPSSAATSVCIRPLVSHSATAPRLISSVNRRFVVLVIIHLLPPRSIPSVAVQSREIGRASCREREYHYFAMSVVDAYYKKKKEQRK